MKHSFNAFDILMRIIVVGMVLLTLWGCTRHEAPKAGSADTVETSGVSGSHQNGEMDSSGICKVQYSVEQLPPACTTNGRYQAVFFNGQKSGYAISGRLQRGDVVENCEFSQIVMKRGAIEMRIASLSNSVETVDGQPISYEMVTEGSGLQKQACGVLKEGKMHIRTSSAGITTDKTVDWEEGTLMQEGLRLLLKGKGLTPGTKAEGKGFDAESESIIHFSYTVKDRASVNLLGRVAPAVEVVTLAQVGTSAMQTIEWLDDDLETLKSESDVMGMKVETIECEKEYALSENSPAEIFTASFLDSPRTLSSREVAQTRTYRIIPTDSKTLVFPESKEQKVIRQSTDEIVVSVHPEQLPRAGALPYKRPNMGDSMTEYLESNSWIQSDHDEIRQLAKQAAGKAKTAGIAAKQIEQFVSVYISNRSLSVGYASALEVAQSKQGDCTEFALLTTALCRAIGIPARVVFGIVYVRDEFEGHSNFFGGHAWSQVYIEGQWYSLDAAMGSFDAGHVAIDFNNGEPSNFFKLITTMGYFEIAGIE
ncbi:MAG: transglutaminase domain-containing protein [Deltaproteobacteria bacterium]|nr:transglutaminase domain-containing protein [Deltaproteobacteria bacterium]MBN2673702.1 transglutaminase domain-containing protein [Deltaproteobacteria bacterium]